MPMDQQRPVTGSHEAETGPFQSVSFISMGSNSKLLPRQILPKVEPGSSSSSPILDARLAGGERAAKRRCISSACMPCRKRKSKVSTISYSSWNACPQPCFILQLADLIEHWAALIAIAQMNLDCVDQLSLFNVFTDLRS
jgi:hypothetical protein